MQPIMEAPAARPPSAATDVRIASSTKTASPSLPNRHAPVMIDVSVRARRALLLNDLPLLRRIIRNNPISLRNPDFADKSNTSLHLAAKLGHVEVAQFLIDAGHEDEGISLNSEWETPLMVACEERQVEVGLLLIAHFPRCVPWANKQGMDALMLCSRHGTLNLLPPLLTSNPSASTSAHDKDGNTALHYASAAGELKGLRLLLQFGASPLAQNAYSWTPVAYSATAAAEAYFKQLVAEFERHRVEAVKLEREREKQRLAGVRLVTATPSPSSTPPPALSLPLPLPPPLSLMLSTGSMGGGGGGAVGSPGGGISNNNNSNNNNNNTSGNFGVAVSDDMGRNSPAGSGPRSASVMSFRPREDSFSTVAAAAAPPVGLEWSPVTPVERKAMTPTESKTVWGFGVRGRAGSGD